MHHLQIPRFCLPDKSGGLNEENLGYMSTASPKKVVPHSAAEYFIILDNSRRVVVKYVYDIFDNYTPYRQQLHLKF